MRLAALTILCLAGCVQFPQIDDATSAEARQARYPDLVPFERITPASVATRAAPVETEETLTARAEELQGRASDLRGTVLSGQDRDRLDETVE